MYTSTSVCHNYLRIYQSSRLCDAIEIDSFTKMAKVVHIIDVDSGNICSLENAIKKLGYEVKLVSNAEEAKTALPEAERVLLPGVGNFGHFMDQVNARKLEPLIKEYILSGKPLMGICVGLQSLFAGSTESPSSKGLGLVSSKVSKFSSDTKSVPHIGWNTCTSSLYTISPEKHYYFVHSYAKIGTEGLSEQGWQYSTCTYGDETFVAALAKDNLLFTQFHPEKSGQAGLDVINAFLTGNKHEPESNNSNNPGSGLTKRVIACLDVRSNDQGDIVVTKGDQYDVREKDDTKGVRNLGKPVEVAEKYYLQGADEVTFLNITSFRDSPLHDQPMLQVLKRASESVFVPLTIGGGIRDTLDPSTNKIVPALEVAHLYFRSGADKVSIGSDAVDAAEQYYANNKQKTGKTPIETISKAYGAQAVIVSVDPKRQYVADPSETNKHVYKTQHKGPNNEEYVWYQCTSKGGREMRDIGAFELAQAVEALGAGELLLNCIDKDGSNSGFDLELVQDIKKAVKIPVIASSGAGNPGHFVEVFEKTNVEAALGAGMFHRGEYTVKQVKEAMQKAGIVTRL